MQKNNPSSDRFELYLAITSIGLLLTPLLYSLWSANIPPSIDSPAHLALVAVIKSLGTEGSALADSFQWGAFPVPNCAFYLIGNILSRVFDLLVVHKIFISLYLVSTPFAVLYFLRVFDRSPLFALAALPLLINWPVLFGFTDFYLGIPVLFATTAFLAKSLEFPSRRMFAWVGVVSYLVYLVHVHIYLIFISASGILLLMHFIDDLRCENRPVNFTKYLGLGLLMTIPVMVNHAIWTSVYGKYYGGIASFQFGDLSDRIRNFGRETILVTEGKADLLAALAWAAALAAGALLYFILAKKRPQEPRRLIAWLYPVFLSVLMVVLYLASPYRYPHDYIFMANRTAILTLFFLLGLVALPGRQLIGRKKPILIFLPFVFASLLSAWSFNGAIQEFNTVTDGFLETLAEAEDQSSMVFYPENRTQAGFNMWLLRHAVQYHTCVNEGPTSFSFGYSPGRIVQQVDLGYDVQQLKNKHFQQPEIITKYDYMLHHGATLLETRSHQGFQLSLISEENNWRLYRISED